MVDFTRERGQAGLLFIELLLGLVIVATLATAAYPKVVAAAKRATARQELGSLAAMVQLFEAETGALPATLTDLEPVYWSTVPDDPWGNPYKLKPGRVCVQGNRVPCRYFN